MANSVIQISNLTRHFGATPALSEVNLSVRRGTVHGLLGANGAGKTTLIKHILGLLRAHTGSVRIFGQDPVENPIEVLARIGYLSEDADLPAWMRVGELMRYSRAFYQDWDDHYAAELQSIFALDHEAKIGRLSKGQKARTGLLVALAYRPELLLLDEPSSGLDPIVRRDILAAVMRTIADEGRTVLFSSHLLEEVEQVADQVTMIRRGRIVLSDSLDSIRASHRCLSIRLPREHEQFPRIDGVLRWDRQGRDWIATIRGDSGELEAAVSGWQGEVITQRSASLDEIFVAHAGSASGQDHAAGLGAEPGAA